MLGISWKEHRTNEFVYGAIKARVGPQEKTDQGIEKKASVVLPHHSPQKPDEKGAAGNTRGGQKLRVTGKVLGRQLERVDQNGQPNPEEMGRGQTCLAFAVMQCVDHLSTTTT